jgi:DNA-binding response OmpR family regulator
MNSIPPPMKTYLPPGRPGHALFATTVALGVENPMVRDDIARILADDGFRVLAFDNGLDMLEYFGDVLLLGGPEILPDLVIAEAALPGRKGLDLLADLRYGGWYTPFVLITPDDEGRLLADARRLGVAAPNVTVVEAPYEIDTLRASVFFLLEMAGPSSEHPPKPRAAAA